MFQNRLELHHLTIGPGSPATAVYPTQVEPNTGTSRGEKETKREKLYECTYGCYVMKDRLKMRTKQDWARHEDDFHAAGNRFYCDQNPCVLGPFYEFKQLQNHQKSAGKLSHPHRCSYNNCAKSPNGCENMTKVPHNVEQVYHCGFCGSSSWGSSKHRKDHVAEHFEAGLTMDSDWRFPIVQPPLSSQWPATDIYKSNAMHFQSLQSINQYAAQSMAIEDDHSTLRVPGDALSGNGGLPYRTQ